MSHVVFSGKLLEIRVINESPTRDDAKHDVEAIVRAFKAMLETAPEEISAIIDQSFEELFQERMHQAGGARFLGLRRTRQRDRHQ